jgi:proteasome lid subunit RPN8/RPN11
MSDKIKLSELQLQQIEDATLQAYPNEMCGFLTAEDFIPVTNISDRPQESFKIDSVDYIKWYKQTIAIVHSHTRETRKAELFDLRTPSYADYVGQKKTAKPWLIVGCEGMSVSDPIQFPRVRSNVYIGRRFQWFLNDCYNLVQDFYWFELGIDLPEAKITPDYDKLRVFDGIFDIYLEEYGFAEVPYEELKENDLVLLDNGGFQSNHLGIYTKGQILHQGLVSVSVPFETYIGRIKKVLRYVKD